MYELDCECRYLHLCVWCVTFVKSDVAAAPDPRTCAIYYFLAAVFVLLVAFDMFFVLPMLVSSELLLTDSTSACYMVYCNGLCI